jgi:hypothetical protein
MKPVLNQMLNQVRRNKMSYLIEHCDAGFRVHGSSAVACYRYSTMEAAQLVVDNLRRTEEIRIRLGRSAVGSFLGWLPRLSRGEYEKLCLDEQLVPLSDDECRYLADYCSPSLSEKFWVEQILAGSRGCAIPKHIEAPPVYVASRSQWGNLGLRYDENCERCGKAATVDNSSGMCRKCH